MIDEAALDQAVLHQCAVTFTGIHAICICKQQGNTAVCRFAKDRLRQVIEKYLVAAKGQKNDGKKSSST
jgi:hypothetical protein